MISCCRERRLELWQTPSCKAPPVEDKRLSFVESRTAINTMTLMGVRTELRMAALLRQRATHVVPRVTLNAMHLRRSLALQLVEFG